MRYGIYCFYKHPLLLPLPQLQYPQRLRPRRRRKRKRRKKVMRIWGLVSLIKLSCNKSRFGNEQLVALLGTESACVVAMHSVFVSSRFSGGQGLCVYVWENVCLITRSSYLACPAYPLLEGSTRSLKVCKRPMSCPGDKVF